MIEVPATVRIATRCFGVCLRLLPAGLRRDAGEEMQRFFGDVACDAHRRSGARGVLRTWLAAVADLLQQAPEQHRAARRDAPYGAPLFPSPLPSPGPLRMHLLTDFRYALRGAIREPLPSTIVILTLAIGIGASTAVFTLVNGVVLRPLGYPRPEQLFVVENVEHGEVGGPISYADFIDVRASVGAIAAGAAYDEWRTNLTGAGDPERLDGALVSANFFEVLGVVPALGRFFRPEEDVDGKDRVVVLSHALWQRKFGGDPEVVGRAVDLDGRQHVVVGVAPRDFEDPKLSGAAWAPPAIWRPLGFFGLPEDQIPGRSGHSYAGVLRLRDGVTALQAQAELDGFMAGLSREFPDTNLDKSMRLVALHTAIVGTSRSSLWLLFGAVGLVMAIAVANVGGLLIARSADRVRETALRVALGARDGRLATFFLCEGTVLAGAGALLGLGLATLLRRLIVASGGDFLARAAPFDARVLLFAVAVAVSTAILCALAPMWHTRRLDLLPAISASGRTVGVGRSAGRRVLVAAEVALAVVLLSGAALLGRSLWNLTSIDPGLRTDRLLVFELTLPSARYESGEASRFFTALLDRLESGGGVEGAASINILPLSGSFDCTTMRSVDGPAPAPGDEVCPQIRTVSPGYARVAGVEIVAGRFLTPDDHADSARVAVVSTSLARALWPDDPSPVGRRLWRGEGRDSIEVVGIAAEVAHDHLENAPPPTIYMAHAQNIVPWHERRATVLVRTEGEPAAAATVARQAVGEIDPLLPLANLRTMRDVVARSVAPERFRTMLLVAFAGSALLLAAIGVYGVIAYAVSRQRHEVAIRVALGAGRARVLRHVLGSGLTPVLAGTVAGLLVALAGSRVLDGMLYGVARTDPLAMAAVPVVLLGVALLAAWVPARRAGRVHPAEALRAD